MSLPAADALPKFPREGRTHKEDCHHFMSAVRALAKHATPGYDANGLLGWLMEPADYSLLTNPAPASPFVLAEAPGDMPAARGDFPAWKFQHEVWQAQQLAMSQLARAVTAALDPVSTAKVRGDLLLENIPLPDIIKSLISAYAVASPQELATNHAILLAPFNPPHTIQSHILRHSDAHFFAATNGQPYGAAAKIQHFRDSLSFCGLFKTDLKIWESNHATVVAQTWASICDAIELAYSSSSIASTSSAGYALASVTIPSLQDLIAENNSLRLALLAKPDKSVAPSSSVRRPQPTIRSASQIISPSSLGLFCWSHTSQNHSGVDCRHPRIGHQQSASWSSKMNSPCH